MTEENEKVEIGWNLDNSYAKLPQMFFTKTNPSPVPLPQLVAFNHSLARSLGLDSQVLQGNDGVEVFAGNKIPSGAFPIAQAYAGHQFGYFTMLGDGRAVLLGEQITPLGERVDIQLKGSGRTPYSRGGDGRAGLGPMLREYIISEAMAGLGIPTSRSLAVVTTGENIFRREEEQGAILTRIASSHLRIGTFQYVAERGSLDELRALADYAIKRHFPHIESDNNPYLALLKEVIKTQASLIAKWQLVGFIHGVMNTDNMTISGETIDYGPCAFMDNYDPATVFSSIDTHGRYAYGNQPIIGQWNLARLAETLLPLVDKGEEKAIKLAEDAIGEFMVLYEVNWLDGMRAKLGIFNKEEDDKILIEELLGIMLKYKADFINTFRVLTFNNMEDNDLHKTIEFAKWNKKWQSRLSRQQQSKILSHQLMKDSNPALIPRNHRVEEALKAAVEEGNYGIMQRLIDILSNPYAHTEEQINYSKLPNTLPSSYQTFCGT